jgi:hypothetical protein
MNKIKKFYTFNKEKIKIEINDEYSLLYYYSLIIKFFKITTPKNPILCEIWFRKYNSIFVHVTPGFLYF